MLILDSHCDTPSQLIRLRNLGINNPGAHIDFPKLKLGGVNVSFFALFTPQSKTSDYATAYTMKMIAKVYESVSENRNYASMAFSYNDILYNKDKGIISILLGMENGSPIQDSIDLLRLYYRLGVRYVTLTHNGDNLIADSASGASTWGGLSPFGREVVKEMNRLGMIVDMAHAADSTFFDCINLSKSPIVSTHSCCRALCNHRRNMSDDMLKALADNGGVIQINFYPVFLSDDFAKYLVSTGLDEQADEIEQKFIQEPANPKYIKDWNDIQTELRNLKRPSYKLVVDHIDYAVKLAGIDSVGIGSDFDGINICPEGLEDVSKINVIFEEMKFRGYSQKDIEKVAGGNFLRVLRKNESNRELIDYELVKKK